ncbi:PP2C family protein-serine/threonine phosphatase [Lyngbya confervoides]|uniref:SpoIIE family protein phosphatase n=1 Tax=Lyngbya confervoides BDU141951 TaxID=1574623 RepID=A0ABD4T7R8_9CYAN|nr:GAF domain-containing SpoIIE family protein phosphatase [Lyngbya confervoides]MCM1984661.1 SpoIIE family protein phosphatase [Lyngbya confervoides BDU141951]
MSAVPIPPQSSSALDVPTTEARTDQVSNLARLKRLVSLLQKEQSKIQDLLGSLSFSLRSFNNLNQFLSLTPLIASRVTEADAAALILFNPQSHASPERLYFHEGNPCPQLRFVLDVATRKLSKQPSQVIPEAFLQQQFEQQLADYRWFSTPILLRHVKPHERGRLYLFSRDNNYLWTETRQKLAQLVADQTSVAIENDDLTARLRKQERLARELEIGAEIQARLLPEHCPNVEGVELAAECKTASQVGGDYFDFIPIYFKPPSQERFELDQADRWSIVIGDVMGKGVPAGLMMTMTRGMLRTDILNRHSPSRILRDLNYVMYGDLESSHRFVTLFYSEYDPKTRTLVYSNAAHHPPLLWRSRTRTLERLDTDGLLIGLDVKTTYSEARVRLLPGDTIIYYTDGFTDAASPDGDRFEEEKLIAAFQYACEQGCRPQQILDYLFQQVYQFTGDPDNPIDDMTLIVFQVKSSPLKLPTFPPTSRERG